MAMLLVKTLFSPKSSRSSYTLLPSFGRDGDSRDTSLDTGLSNGTLEKDTQGESPASRFRVDPRIVSDATIGLSDGLTVPFALTAGLSALGDTKLVIYGGLAELIAGGISMGLGGYLGAASEAQGYAAALSETQKMVSEDSDKTIELIKAAFDSYGLSADVSNMVATQLLASAPANTENFIMRFHHNLPDSANAASRAYVSALTIAAGYFFGGLVPLTPYFLAQTNQVAFRWSVAVMAVALFVFGYVKTLLVGEGKRLSCAKAGVQMMVLGGVAAAAAMACVKAVGGS
ncbi:hypothetical protein MBLNU459_g4064t1 [Dothideomycetes sp. NU459]